LIRRKCNEIGKGEQKKMTEMWERSIRRGGQREAKIFDSPRSST
jgi:hypothetical protein